MSRRFLLTAFAVSGACGLIYELVWMRRLALVFGSTTLAVSTVLASFMGGLALGSLLLGRYADRRPERALRTYGFLEFGIGVSALCIPGLLHIVERLYLFAYPSFEGRPQVFSLLQFFLASAVLIVPTAFMGGTLPLLVRYSVSRQGEIGKSVGSFYAANTIGAASGVLLSTYVLLPYWGIAKTEVVAAAANFCVGAAVLLSVARRRVSHSEAAEVPANAEHLADAPMAAATSRADIALLLGIALSGFAAIAYEVIWSRVLSSILGSSIYAIGMVLLVFLIGISLGSAILGRLRLTKSAALEAFAITQAGLGLAGLLALDRLPALPALFLRLFPAARSSFFLLQLVELLVVAALLLVPALLFGAAFPSVVAALAGSSEEAGGRIGQVVVWNTAGNVAGAFLAGFVLIPKFGLSVAFVTVIVASGLAALIVEMRAPTRRRGLLILAAAGSLLVAVLLPPWPPEVLASGVGFFAPEFRTPARWREAMESLDLLFYKDGINTTISVDRLGPYIYYRSNGKTDASTGPGDMADQLYLGHLGMLLHPQPRDVFVLGLGTGVTAASVARYPVHSVDIVDIEPASREASAFFAARNRNVLADPRVRLILADGRNALLARPQTYDVIISDPSDVWVAGVGNLFTRQFYEIARSRLRPGGVMVQWLHLHALPLGQMRLLAATFQSAFPHAMLWHVDRGSAILTGTVDPVAWDFNRLQARFRDVPGVAQDFDGLGIRDSLSLFAGLALTEADLRSWITGVRELHSDDRPVIEFFSPRGLYADTVSANVQELETRQRELLPPIANFMPEFGLAEGRYRLGVGYLAFGRTEQGLRLLEDAVRLEPANVVFLAGLGEVFAHVGRDDDAEKSFRRALQTDSAQPAAVVGLAGLLQKKGRADDAEAILREGLRQRPGDPAILEATGNLLFNRQRYADALRFFERAIEKSPRNPYLALMAGQCLGALNRTDEARVQLRRALDLAPNNPSLQTTAGQSLLDVGDGSGAAAAFAKAVALEPYNRAALLGLSKAARLAGDSATALDAERRLKPVR